MDKSEFISVCGPDKGPQLALRRDGALFTVREGQYEPLDFNGMYRGYYPACEFTALEYGGVFWLGGTADDLPILFTSLMGGVWTRRNIEMSSPEGGELSPVGRILRILWDGRNRQAHLVLSSGQLVTLPDCAKCVRIRTVVDGGVTDGRLDGRDAVLTLQDGGELRVPLDDLMQLRVAWSWALPHIREGAAVYDLRLEAERKPGDLPFEAVWTDSDDAFERIKTTGKDGWGFILCRRGIKADVLTKAAREAGYLNIWSIGGVEPPFHVD